MPAIGRKPSRTFEAGLVLLLLVVWLLTWLPRLRGPIDLRWDAAVYYTLGTALAEGRGYRLLNEPGEIRGVQYPPGLPLLVGLHQRVLGTADPVVVGIALRRFYFVLSGLYVLSVYWLLRRPFGPAPAALGAAACAASMNFVWVSDRCYSDLPFLCATTSFMLFARAGPVWSRFGAATSAATAFLLRTLGASLLIGWIAEAALARQWNRVAARSLLALLLVGGWQGYVWTIQHSAEYLTPAYPYQRAPYLLYNVSYTTNASLRRQFFPEQGQLTARDLFDRFTMNVARLPVTVGEVLSASSADWYVQMERIRNVPVIGLVARWRAVRTALTVLGVLTLVGLAIQFRRGDVRDLFIVLTYVTAVCAMIATEDFGRYLSDLAPFLILALFTTVLGTRARESVSATQRFLLASIVLAIFLGEALTLRSAYAEGFSPVTHRQWHGHEVTYGLFSYDDTFRSFDAGIEWVSTQANAGDVIASSQPHWVYLRTGRRAVMPPFDHDLGRQQTLLDSVPVTYVIVDSNGFSATREYSFPVLKDNPGWERVYASADATMEVYRRRRAQR